MEHYSVIKKNKILPFVTIEMDLEGFMLSEISQTEEDKYHVISLICAIQKGKKKKNKPAKLIGTEKRLVVARGKGWEDGGKWVKGVKNTNFQLSNK